MRSSHKAACVSVAALVLGAAQAGCGKKSIVSSFVPNQLPSVTLTAFPIDTATSYSYVVRANWVGYDPDGKVDYFQYAILDAGASVDTIRTWQQTTRNEQTFFFRSRNPDSIVVGYTTLSDYHTFVIRAIDNQGGASPMVWRSFFSFTAAPTVRITSPAPDSLLIRKLPPSVFIQWAGDDPDGEFTKKPVRYKFKLYSVTDLQTMNPPIDPDRPVDFLRFAPNFADWDSVSGDTTSRLFTDLNPDQDYVFIVTGFDEAGGFDPVFTRKTNVLRLRVTLSATLGPRITMFNDFIYYEYASGGYARDPSRWIELEEPANTRLSWNWFAVATEGALVRRSRWRLTSDTTEVELDDETPRENEATDLFHWSRWQTVGQTQDQAYHAEIGNYPGNPCGVAHLQGYFLYVEVEDNINLRSLAIVHSHVVRPCFTPGDAKMLIVDDRRGQPDGFRLGNLMNPPLGAWPTEAELDTLLYAVGGVPWRGYDPRACLPGVSNCPAAQVNSTPGLFAGYSFDTLDTRQGLFDLTMPLSTLSKYYNVLWYTDVFSANIPLAAGALGEQGNPPLTSLVWMNSPNRANSLAIFSRQGGRMMFFGGGAAFGTLFAWSNGRVPSPWAADGARPVLFPGRFAYDFLQLRATSQAGQGTVVSAFPRRRSPTSNLTNMALWRSFPADGLPYFRNQGQMPGFSVIEYVKSPLFVLEDRDPGPGLDEVPALDTLFIGGGGGVPDSVPCGFYYHSETVPPIHGDVIFLGFDLWSWRFSQERQNLAELLDKLWNIRPSGGPVPRAAMATARRR